MDTIWSELEQRFQTGEVFDVTISEVVKGGLVADIGVRAFMPASQVERHFVEDFSGYKDRVLPAKIVEFDPQEKKVIISHKAVQEIEEKQKLQQAISSIQPGQILTGTVARITSFGVFVNLGSIDGLVHISELSWSRVEDPASVVKIGDEVQVKILKVEPEKGKISLSIKEATPGPWANVEKQFQVGEVVNGVVRRIATFGAFVEIADGIEGLVHVSQVSRKRIASPAEVLEIGQEVKVKILEIHPEAGRISLSIREAEGERTKREAKATPNPVQNIQGTGATLGDLFGDLLKQMGPKS